MKVLVAIANHGVKNDAFCRHLIDTYRAMSSYDATIVVLSDRPKDYGPAVEVLVGAPTDDPWSLPFAHRPVFVARQNDFDLFVYTEDDTEILERHLDLFVESHAALPDDKILGFLRYENDDRGQISYSTVHHVYHWKPDSVLRVEGRVYARYTNDHAGAYILTKSQLRGCIRSGGYRIQPHATFYDLLVSAATDPYTMCGLDRVVCISELLEYTLHHLPNVYLDRIGVSQREVEAQVEVLLSRDCDQLLDKLFEPTTNLRAKDSPWDKKYYEPLNHDLLAAVPSGARRVLSVGCERGINERHLIERGHEVVAIPVDPVIAAAAELQGIRVLPSSVGAALAMLQDERFDAIVFNHSLSYFADPSGTVRMLSALLAPGGSVIVAFVNMGDAGLLRSHPRTLARVRFDRRGRTGVRWTTERSVKRWIEAGGVRWRGVRYHLPGRRATLAQRVPSIFHRFLASAGVAVADSRV